MIASLALHLTRAAGLSGKALSCEAIGTEAKAGCQARAILSFFETFFTRYSRNSSLFS